MFFFHFFLFHQFVVAFYRAFYGSTLETFHSFDKMWSAERESLIVESINNMINAWIFFNLFLSIERYCIVRRDEREREQADVDLAANYLYVFLYFMMHVYFLSTFKEKQKKSDRN